MQGTDLIQYLEGYEELKKAFDGIFSIDTLPKTLKLRHFLICNTDIKSGKGINHKIKILIFLKTAYYFSI
jgi:hypothetical protein